MPLRDTSEKRKGLFTGNGLRHAWYAEAIRANCDVSGGAKSKQLILVTDGTDIFFQRDIFRVHAHEISSGKNHDLIFFGDR